MNHDESIHHKRRSDGVTRYAAWVSILVGLTALLMYGKSALSEPIRDREMLLRHDKLLYDIGPQVQRHEVVVATLEERTVTMVEELKSINRKLDRMSR